jgi:hypothetical protein
VLDTLLVPVKGNAGRNRGAHSRKLRAERDGFDSTSVKPGGKDELPLERFAFTRSRFAAPIEN